MWHKRICLVALIVGAFAVLASGCSQSPYFVAEDEPWRKEAEMACLRSGAVSQSPFLVETRQSLGGPSVCGALHPLQMAASADGAVELKPAAILQCAMVPAVERWMREAVIPAAHHYFGMGVKEAKVLSSYSCRPRNGVAGDKLSEHGHANAIDIGRFTLVDGRTVSVKSGWKGSAQERGFLRDIHKAACRYFTTVLGPDANAFHRDHFHLDLARHGRRGDGRYCK